MDRRMSLGVEGGARPLSGACACRAARTSGPVRAASSSPICCRPRASFHNRGRRRRDPPRSSCWAAGAFGRKRPGTSPRTRRSLPFKAIRSDVGASTPHLPLRTNDEHGSFLSRIHRSCYGFATPSSRDRPLQMDAARRGLRTRRRRTVVRASRGTPACLLAGQGCRTTPGTTRPPGRVRRVPGSAWPRGRPLSRPRGPGVDHVRTPVRRPLPPPARLRGEDAFHQAHREGLVRDHLPASIDQVACPARADQVGEPLRAPRAGITPSLISGWPTFPSSAR